MITVTIDHLDGKPCPDCFCSEIIEFRKEQRHCSGSWNEYIKYKCGLNLHFSPNFMKVVSIHDCRSKEIRNYALTKVVFNCPECNASNEFEVKAHDTKVQCIACCANYSIPGVHPVYAPHITVRRC